MKQIVFDLKNMDLPTVAKKVKSGELIIYPTDTVYGVGGIIEKEEALKKIYVAKERTFSSPLIALVSDENIVEKIAYIDKNKEKIEKLMKSFWPGALTIILRKKKNVPSVMVSGGESIGVRMPNHPLALDIIRACGGILATTSANISGEPSPKRFSDVSEEFKKRVDILVDGGACNLGIESTIIDMREKPFILRHGGISKEEIEKIIGKF
ncbi:L-threonylcarbamoyladenylate synthase [Ilyobacter polytropus]|uniref:L-threonylcarbamoyladenylate synthase n=1 Tax=Ilyobacter polytropus (strain ATCC 51220 / DSM 2926 / LMG 16218 / CuHBu1) TaxID=572544 RepID=E3H839_ILYPC|nr:L-threonylcarbamoyladenylate synthase [Ilyobacter polytropus]ADO83270.1 translation factor SUA5 [Ilyobacter polytropus DSM 2926]